MITEGMITAGFNHAHSVGTPVTSVQVADVLEGAEAAIRADERRRVMGEMAAFARELEQVGRPTMARLVKDMWTRVNRRLDKS
jgi:hypothetical protein